jgi:SPP1 family phage portal protein
MLQMEQPIAVDGVLNYSLLEKVMEYHCLRVPKLKRLKDYYDGLHDILKREMPEEKPNNKVVVNYARYITDIMQGYFIGKPVTYKYPDDKMSEIINNIHKYNDEQDENSELANMTGIFGESYELIYLDEQGDVRYNKVSPLNGFIVYDTKINPAPLFAIRVYGYNDLLLSKEIVKVEVYDSDFVYMLDYTDKKFKLVETYQHFFNDVPVVEYPNNSDRTGDFENVITMIDAYNLSVSNTQNDAEYFSDSYLALIGMTGTTEEDVADMKKNRVLLLDEAGQAYFLVKPSNDADSQNNKNRLNSDIHKMSFIPDISDENFAGNASGVAMSYKLFALDQIISNKERKFKTALMRRLEIICNYLAIKNIKFDYKQVEIQFARNKPVDEKQAVEIFEKLKGQISDLAALSYLPMIEDPRKELEQIEKEREDSIELYQVPLEGDDDGEES